MKKQSLKEVKPQYVKRQRLKDLISYVRDFCAQHHEDIIDVIFFLLKNELQIQENPRVSTLDRLRIAENTCTLSAEGCLAMRVDALQSKEQYRFMHDLLKHHS